MTPKVIYEDENFLAVDKPANLLVHPARNPKSQIPNFKEPTLIDWILKRYPETKDVGDQPETRPGIVHRLDRDTSGLILIARNQKYFEYLKNLFQTHQIKKTYLALVWGKLEPRKGIIKKPIRIKTGTIKRTVWQGKAEKEAITGYQVLKYLQSFSLIEVVPKTGRTHQIRIHLASIGHPIVGDKLYGLKKISLDKLGIDLNRQFLHAQSLEFSPEAGKRIKIEAELPEELKIILDTIS